LKRDGHRLARLAQDAGQKCPVCGATILAARYDSVPVPLAHADPLIQRFERWARGRLAEGFSLEKAAEVLGTSKRTLARRMQNVLGRSPLAFFQDLRIERALHLLRTSRASVDQIALKVGYAKGVTLRALLRQRLGRGVREIRGSQSKVMT
jgi:transcriptional regulator GlxA family with amidase domain